MKIWSTFSFGAFIEPVKEINKKIFNIKIWHFWKSFFCFVSSVVDYVARTTICKHIFVLRQYVCHDGTIFPYMHRCVAQLNSYTVSPIYNVFSKNGVNVVKKRISVTFFHPPISKRWADTFPFLSWNKQIEAGFSFFMTDLSFDPSVPREYGLFSSVRWVRI